MGSQANGAEKAGIERSWWQPKTGSRRRTLHQAFYTDVGTSPRKGVAVVKLVRSFVSTVLSLPFMALALIFPTAVIVPPVLAALGVVSWKVPVLVWLFIAPTIITQVIGIVLLFRWYL